MLRTLALSFAFCTVAVLSAQQNPNLLDTTVLRVSRVVLYKSGIGYFEHLGNVTGNQSLAVQFTGDQLDDVLKSLTAVDLGEGRIAGISYDSPTPMERRLQALRVPLAQKATTLQLLDALRGSRVEVRSSTGTTVGRLLNVERRTRPTGERSIDRDEITLVTNAGEITTMELDGSTRVRLADADLRQDVGRYLDIASSHGDRSARRVVLSTVGDGARQVLVGYVAEAPVWKTTYRLVFPSTGARQPLLQGWAIVDNISAADWEGVELSLVAGAPQVFRQPLSTPLFATRPYVPLHTGPGLAPLLHAAPLVRGNTNIVGFVRDSTGAALPGTEVSLLDQTGRIVASVHTDAQGHYEISGVSAGTFTLRAELFGFGAFQAAVTAPASGTVERSVALSGGGLQETVTVAADAAARRIERPAAGTVGGGISGVAGGRTAAAPPSPPAQLVEQRMIDQTVAASSGSLGELFEYRLKDRVTIKRNQSALVPILQTSIKADRISVWNDSIGLRPRRGVWLTNTSDLTLDAGSLAVVDAGAFAGEGLIDPIKPGERRLISFAADIGVQVDARRGESPGRITKVAIAKGVVTQESEQRERRTYTIRNDDSQSRVVIIEHPRRQGWRLVSVAADESTPAVHRFRVTAPPAETTTFNVDEVQQGTMTFAVTDLHRERLLAITAERGDALAALEKAMAPVFAKSVELDVIEAGIAKANAEVESIAADQQRVRQNMAVLKGTSEERRLLQRYMRQLEDQESRLETLKQELASLTARQSRAGEELDALIAAVTIEVTL